ncbi:MAG: phosphoserine transaminase [Gammaproteobacteria bacterium]|nr:MAG: phosphoserine transaminase [Gammaproteobacteria bacterium]
MQKPINKPENPCFSSGPCSKRPGWTPEALSHAVLGKSHRGKAGKAKLAEVIELTKAILPIPDNYHVGIVPASDTGAVEMALWSLLGPKTVDLYAWESFSQTWLREVVNQLKLDNNQYTADYGELSDLSNYNPDNDSVFVFNGTTSGVRVPDLNWIDNDRDGLTICDATSAVFSQSIDFNRLDVATWSWQKALGGEAAHGMIVLSPRAVNRLESYTPTWPMPKIFTLTKNGKLNRDIFLGSTINTPSMLCVEDAIDAMKWLQSIGGQAGAQAISDENLAIISDWVAKTSWIDFLARLPETRSNTSICLSITDKRFTTLSDSEQRDKIKSLCTLLESENAAYDINAYKAAPPGLRIWAGATIEPKNVAALLPWIEWAFRKVI